MNKADLIIKTFINPILYRIDDAIMELSSEQKKEFKLKRIKDNLESIRSTCLNNCNREIENNFPYFHDLQLNIVEGKTLDDITKDFVDFYNALNECVAKIDLNGDLTKVLEVFTEMKKTSDNYKEAIKSITNFDKADPIQGASNVLEEIEDMEKELQDIVGHKDIEEVKTDTSEEMSAYDRFIQVINEQDEDDISVDDILKDIKGDTKNEDEIVEDLYVLNCMLDDGEKGVAELYPSLSKYNYSKNINCQTCY